ncbi:EpsG family protein, partial [Neobacillus rhizosphaerae]|uniref:EpsG family protein n=1 Tax=Neobacillus rhizosphaerae TaxID=2880965 RepID=UPI00222861D2
MLYKLIILSLSCVQFIFPKIKEHINNKYRRLILIIFGILLVFMAGTRNKIGYDYDGYRNIFDNIAFHNLSFSNANVEPGFYLINVLSINFYMVIFLCALIAIPLKLFVFFKKSEAIIISLILYLSTIFLTYDMGVIRQGIAISFIFLSVIYLEERKLIKFISCILFAMLFHITSITFLPAYFLVNRNFSRKLIYTLTLACLIIGLIGFGDLLFEISKIIPNTMVGEKLAYYQTSEYNTSMISITMVKRFFFLIFFVEISRRFMKNSISLNIYINCYFIGSCIYYLFKSVSLISDR